MKQKKKNSSQQNIAAETSGKAKRKLHIALLFLLGVVLYINTLNHGYVLDDHLFVIGNKFVTQGIDGIKDIWTNDAFVGAHGRKFDLTGGRYRPLSITTFAIEYEIFGKNPKPGHFFNILLYALTGVCIYLTLLRFVQGKNEWFPFFTAVLFLIHPIHTEVVANIKSRDEILCLLFALLAFYYMLGEKKHHLIWANVFFLLSLLSKESSFPSLAIIPLTFYFFRDADLKTIIKKSIPFFITALFYLILRTSFTGFLGETKAKWLIDNPFLYAHFDERLATVMLIGLLYIRLLFWPHPLSYDYSYNQIPLTNFSDWRVWLAIAVFIAMIYFIVKGWKNKRIYAYGLLFYLIHYALISNLFFNIGTNMGERFLYYSSLGFCIAISDALIHLLKIKSDTPLQWRLKYWLPMLVIIPLGGYATIQRNKVWKSNYILYRTDIESVPQSARAQMFIGIEQLNQYYKNKRPSALDSSIMHLKKATEINPEFYHAYYNLGLAYQAKNQHKKAIEAFQNALKNEPRHINSHFYLGMSYGKLGNTTKAIEYMEKAIKYGYNGPDKYTNMGVAYAINKQYKKALNVFLQGLEKNPNDITLLKNIAITYQQIGQPEKAQKYLDKIKQLQKP